MNDDVDRGFRCGHWPSHISYHIVDGFPGSVFLILSSFLFFFLLFLPLAVNHNADRLVRMFLPQSIPEKTKMLWAFFPLNITYIKKWEWKANTPINNISLSLSLPHTHRVTHTVTHVFFFSFSLSLSHTHTHTNTNYKQTQHNTHTSFSHKIWIWPPVVCIKYKFTEVYSKRQTNVWQNSQVVAPSLFNNLGRKPENIHF